MSATRQPGLSRREALGIYVHIPFCVAKCGYCDFVSVPLVPGRVAPYLAALEREIRGSRHAGARVSTVYVGGGTPSLLEAGQLAGVLEAVRATFEVDPGAEISLEANPGTLSGAKARDFLALGVNRVSLGVQSLDDALLRRIGRRHGADEARRAFATLREAGCANVGIDLMHGLPGQSAARWRRDLASALALGPEHLSLYALGIEPGTALERERRRGGLRLPSEDEEATMLDDAVGLTAGAGYERYEISNYARPGFRCRHNVACWRCGEYAGFGAGAHSFLRQPSPVRLANTADIEAYVRLAGAGECAVAMQEECEPRRLAGEALMLALRTAEGIEVRAFEAAHGGAPDVLFPKAFEEATARGWVESTRGRLRLTREGMLYSDALFRQLF